MGSRTSLTVRKPLAGNLKKFTEACGQCNVWALTSFIFYCNKVAKSSLTSLRPPDRWPGFVRVVKAWSGIFFFPERNKSDECVGHDQTSSSEYTRLLQWLRDDESLNNGETSRWLAPIVSQLLCKLYTPVWVGGKYRDALSSFSPRRHTILYERRKIKQKKQLRLPTTKRSELTLNHFLSSAARDGEKLVPKDGDCKFVVAAARTIERD